MTGRDAFIHLLWMILVGIIVIIILTGVSFWLRQKCLPGEIYLSRDHACIPGRRV